jgi:hypothetical protein
VYTTNSAAPLNGGTTNRESGTIDIGSSFLSDETALFGFSETFPSDVANRALINARTKLKSQDINLAQAFAERDQTARLIAENLSRIAHAYLALKHGHFNDVKKFLNVKGAIKAGKSAAQSWLELQYGWKPLLSDIHGAVTALDKRDRSDYRITIRAKAQRNLNFGANTGAAGSYACRRISTQGFHSSFVRIDACPSGDALSTAAALGLTNPLDLSWELLPFSFVVDWAYPLGDYINQMDACVGWEIKGFSQSNFTKLFSRWGFLPGHQSGGSLDTHGSWVATRRLVKLGRSGGVSVPFPFLPRLKSPLSGLHVANAIALLAGAFGGSSHVK